VCSRAFLLKHLNSAIHFLTIHLFQGTNQLRSIMQQVQIIEKETLEVERAIGLERYECRRRSLNFLHCILLRAYSVYLAIVTI
jgi:hypothetical protein